MARTPGAKDLTPRKTAKKKMPRYSPDEILAYKIKILDMLEAGEAFTLTQCAEKLEIPALRIYHWSVDDKDFQSMVHLAQQVRADIIEEEFVHHANFIPKMMLLKSWRPQYRDNFKVDITNNKLEDMLQELKQLGQKSEQHEPESTV